MQTFFSVKEKHPMVTNIQQYNLANEQTWPTTTHKYSIIYYTRKYAPVPFKIGKVLMSCYMYRTVIVHA